MLIYGYLVFILSAYYILVIYMVSEMTVNLYCVSVVVHT